jgi:oligopeptide/dipeptide ABC transporter ATP-binding protein
MTNSPTIVVDRLCKRFYTRRGGAEVIAVDDVSFKVAGGTTLGVVGESGSGKSTLARCLLGLVRADSGRIEVLGTNVTATGDRELRAWRKNAQIVFQEPHESLDPRLRVEDAIAEPLAIHSMLYGEARNTRVAELLGLVALDPSLAARYPHQLSGGQAQRVNLARALATEPHVLVLDEPTSSLDVSVRAGILQLLAELQRRLGLTCVLISHDLPTIRSMCDRIAVMYLGRMVEFGDAESVLAHPCHPYTEYLLEAELSLDPAVKPVASSVAGAIDSTATRSRGCVFAPRCPMRIDECEVGHPPLEAVTASQSAACIRAADRHQAIVSYR